MLRVHYLYRVGKIAADADAGWYAVVNGQKNICLLESFKTFPGQEYPDGASIESWNDGPGTISRGPFDQILPDDPSKTPYFLESEVISPYATLDPGEQYEFTVYWSPSRAPNPVVDSRWAGVVSQPLAGKISGNEVTLKGVFGVFFPGTVEAVFYSDMGEELSHTTLQGVDPREVFRLDKSLQVPTGAFRVSVRLMDAEGQNRGYLGNVILKNGLNGTASQP